MRGFGVRDAARLRLRAWARLAVLLAALTLSARGELAMAQAYTYSFVQRMPAQYDAVLNLKSLAVLPLKGNDGSNFSAALTGELQALRVGKDPLFTLRNEEGGPPPNKGRNAAAAAASFVVNMGRTLGVNGVVWGDISASAVPTAYKGATTDCSNNSCRQVPVDCVRIDGSYTVFPKIYSVATGQLVYSEPVHKEISVSNCGGVNNAGGGLLGSVASLTNLIGGRQDKVQTPEAIMTTLRTQAVKEIAAKFTPQTRNARIGFKTRAPELDKAGQEQFANAVEFLKSGRPDRACGQFEAMGQGLQTAQVSLLFNLGACREVNGNIRSAQEYYARADSLLTRPDTMINEALKRTDPAAGGRSQ